MFSSGIPYSLGMIFDVPLVLLRHALRLRNFLGIAWVLISGQYSSAIAQTLFRWSPSVFLRYAIGIPYVLLRCFLGRPEVSLRYFLGAPQKFLR